MLAALWAGWLRQALGAIDRSPGCGDHPLRPTGPTCAETHAQFDTSHHGPAQARHRFRLHTYVYDSSAESIGCRRGGARRRAEPDVEELMAEVDGRPVCAVVPSDCEVSMKKPPLLWTASRQR